MSLFRRIGKIAKKAVGVVSKVAGFIPGPVGTVGRIAGTVSKVAGIAGAGAVAGKAVVRSGARLPPLPTGRTLPGIGSVVKSAAGTAAGVAVYDAAGNLISTGRRRRTMNPMNHRALNRALRRVEKAKSFAKRLSAITIRKKDC